MSLGFANFYRQFIFRFSQIAAPLTSMLKTAKLRKSKDGVGGDSGAGRDRSENDGGEVDDDEVDGGEIRCDEFGKKGRKTSKSKNLSKFKKTVETGFFTPRAKLAFTKFRQAFFKAPILHHFNPEHHIWIETDASGYAIGGVVSQLTSEDLGRWHPLAFFSHKMILMETRYKTYDNEL